ncbi:MULTISPECIES: DUF393 domain-containing protein [Idiomarina]|nr:MULTISPECIES: DUF393 domain-containing protein [Idiomarina]MEC7644037.1 DUF393 domain-containing protein [Pseudomonadota bacterium]MEC8924990.1 DUF393 domain-containing protein [Pseudomonadota bacterium]
MSKSKPKTSGKVLIFYDGGCPLCVKEMRHLKRLDTNNKLAFENINVKDFSARYPDIDPDAANQFLHGINADGNAIYGLDVTHAAWQAVGKGAYIAPLRWPVIRWFADRAYLLFAKHRNRISRWVTGQARCEQCNL